MSNDRRYTYRGCQCGDAFCAGCDDESWPALGDSQHHRERGRWATAFLRWLAKGRR